MESSERNKKGAHCLCLLHNLFIFSFSSGVIRAVKMKQQQQQQQADAYISGSANNYKLNNKFNIARPWRPVILFIVYPLCLLLSGAVCVYVCSPLTVYIRTRSLPFNEPTKKEHVLRPATLFVCRPLRLPPTYIRPFGLTYTCRCLSLFKSSEELLALQLVEDHVRLSTLCSAACCSANFDGIIAPRGHSKVAHFMKFPESVT